MGWCGLAAKRELSAMVAAGRREPLSAVARSGRGKVVVECRAKRDQTAYSDEEEMVEVIRHNAHVPFSMRASSSFIASSIVATI